MADDHERVRRDQQAQLQREETYLPPGLHASLLEVGTVVGGQYEISGPGRPGGMGVVYPARDLELGGEPVALKLMRAELVASVAHVKDFRDEALNGRRLTDKGIVRVHQFGEWQGKKFLVMDWVGGGSLRAELNRLAAQGGVQSGLSWRDSVSLVCRLTAALKVAHDMKIVHLDLKPENVLLEPAPSGRGDLQRPRLADFGLSKLLNREDLSRSAAAGTAGYMAPERLEGAPPNPQMDVFSVGVMLYELVCGRMPIGRFKLPHELDASLPPKLDSIVDRCLAPEPNDRYATATELLVPLQELETWARNESSRPSVATGADAIGAPEQRKTRVDSSKRLVFWTGVAAAAAVGGVALLFIVLPASRPPVAVDPGPPRPSAPLVREGASPRPSDTQTAPPTVERQLAPPGREPTAPPIVERHPAPSAREQTAPPIVARHPAPSGQEQTAPLGIEVRSTPSGADVFLNWAPRGRTPVTFSPDDLSGLLVLVKDGHEVQAREIKAPAPRLLDISLKPEGPPVRGRVLLAGTDDQLQGAHPALRAALATSGLSVVDDSGTREYLAQAGRAGGASNPAFRAWARARYGIGLVVIPSVRRSQRDLGDQDLGHPGLRDVTRGLIRTEVTVDLEIIDLGTGASVGAVSGKGSAFALNRTESADKAAQQAIAEAARALHQRLTS